jgi:hypothetical protein
MYLGSFAGYRFAEQVPCLDGSNSGSDPPLRRDGIIVRERWLGEHASHSMKPDRDPSSTAGRAFLTFGHAVRKTIAHCSD